MSRDRIAVSRDRIAVIGMAGRFPGAGDVEGFWRNVRQGVECITFFEEQELLEAGLPAELVTRPDYVGAAGVLDDVESFDSDFFGFTSREAEVTDPQLRLFLEASWHALEDAGYAGAVAGSRVGVFGGVGPLSYLWTNVIPALEPLGLLDPLQARLHNDKDFATTWVSYKLGLEGPSVAVQSACSTSLVAVHLACQSLLTGDADLALAGGAFVALPHRAGYLHQRGGVTSPDGHCRPFDASGRGFVMGSGAAVVVLKRLAEAQRDGDRIDAVVLGSAVDNDGAVRAGFTAPGVDGQVGVVQAALARAGVAAGSIGYVEAHGTGTTMGDPVEIAALAAVFGPADAPSCALGTVKANIGHLDAAAGVAGFIKAALLLRHGEIPPVVNFVEPNPLIELDGTPFYVPTEPRRWAHDHRPRRAGVTSLGMGGTNAHVVLEEPPASVGSRPAHGPVLLTLSARTDTALEQMSELLADRLRTDDDLRLDDAAWTLQVGRKHLGVRRAVVADTAQEAVRRLEEGDEPRRRTGTRARPGLSVAFVFPGQGAQYRGMGRSLYEDRGSAFRHAFDECAAVLAAQGAVDPASLLYGPGVEDDALSIDDTAVAQPLLFVVEYALARQWSAWGIEPVAMAGHSLGEYVAACLAGTFSLSDALRVVTARGRLMQACPPGSMLAVQAPVEEVRRLLGAFDAGVEAGGAMAVAAVNGARSCVVSGPAASVRRFEEAATQAGLPTSLLRTSHAFHSPSMEEAVPEFVGVVASAALSPPSLPLLSNVTGTWLRDDEATDPAYWGRHLRATVRFSDNLAVLLGLGDVGVVEVGPPALAGVVRRQPGCESTRPVVTSLPPRDDSPASDARHLLLRSLGTLWAEGASVHWPAVSAVGCRRVGLPLYPFERRRHWLDPPRPDRAAPAHAQAAAGEPRSTPEPAPAVPTTPDGDGLGSIENIVLGIWRDVFGVPDVTSTDNFFDLGGDSLAALQLVNRIADTLGVELPMETLFDAETVADLAGVVKEAVRP